MGDEQELTVATEDAWRGFRQRVADHVAQMDDDDVLVMELADAVEDDDDTGSAPYVQVCALDGSSVRVEAVGNAYLHSEFLITSSQEAAMLDLGWSEPEEEPASGNFYDYFERRAADEVAVLLVATLRGVYGVPHPAFLDASGLERDPDLASSLPRPSEEEPEELLRFAHDRDLLQEFVDDALRRVFPELRHDGDGDIPIVCGQSLAFVRVAANRPCVELFAEIVIDPTEEADRVLLELDLLNAEHPMWSFYRRGSLVRMSYEMFAVPLVPMHLRMAVERFCDEVDEIARTLAVRVAGRRFLDPDPGAEAEDDVLDDFLALPDEDAELEDPDPAMVGLLELLHLGPPRPSTVAGLFEHDRLAVITQLVRIRTGLQGCDGHDQETVLTVLRQALRLISDGDARPRLLPPFPAKPRSVQPSLLSDDEAGESALDLGWSA